MDASGDEGEVDLEGMDGRAEAFATSKWVGRALLEKLTWLRSWQRPENKLAAKASVANGVTRLGP